MVQYNWRGGLWYLLTWQPKATFLQREIWRWLYLGIYSGLICSMPANQIDKIQLASNMSMLLHGFMAV